MSGSGKSGDNRGNRRRFSKRRERDSSSVRQDTSRSEGSGRNSKKAGENPLTDGKFEKSRNSLYERPRWIPPKTPSEPIPIPDCPWCGQPIKDISAAIADKATGAAIHFDCVIARLGEGETLESGDAISYIGGGRFGVIHFSNPSDAKDFTIKKIFEWENKDDRSEWRRSISDHFSVT
ncbi:hypothetical protein AGMMS50293_05360 [Spirochaetia bacterium]|nr:hypothetical protein AGMMS50293_05360 [Spirochaetia bacterium]